MPFGLKCASNSFIRAVNAILQPIKDFTDSYVDDLATFSGSWELHLQHVHQFRGSGLTLKLENSYDSKVGYLTKYQNFSNSKWRTAAILKIVFWLYLDERLSD